MGPHRSPGGVSPSPLWAPLVILVFFIIGTNQTLMLYPSRWQETGWSDVARLRTPLFFTPAWLIYLGGMVATRRWPTRATLPLSLIYAVLAVASVFLMFHAIDLMAGHGLRALVFPMGVGTSLLLFQLYSRIIGGERLRPLAFAGVCLILCGILALAASSFLH